MMIFYVFLAAESESDIRFSPTLLDLAVKEVGHFAFLKKIEENFLCKSELSLYFRSS